jgi:hypothetical protein
MPLYYFHVRNGLGFTRDDEGQDLPDTDAARKVALRGIRSMLASEVAEGRIDLRGRIEVTDAEGESVFEVPFDDAIVLLTGDPPSA